MRVHVHEGISWRTNSQQDKDKGTSKEAGYENLALLLFKF
jgi:hypothetical protein